MSLRTSIALAVNALVRRDDDEDTDCIDAVPGRHGHVPITACNSYYNYDPEFAPAVAVAVIFGLLLAAHLFFGIHTRKVFSWVVIMGAAWETVSFSLHSVGSLDQQNSAYAIGWLLLFLLAPLWINAFVYMTFARMVQFYLGGRRLLKFPARWITKLFVWADVFAFLVQATGGSMLSPGSGAETNKRFLVGLNVYLGGMGLQLFFIAVFFAFMVRFQLIMRSTAVTKQHWKSLTFALYSVLICIMVRIAFRIAEFAPGLDISNPIIYHEAYSYALDAFPMMVALLVLVVWYPGRVLVGPESEFPKGRSRKEKKEERRQKKEEKKRRKQERKMGHELDDSEPQV